MLDAVRAIVSAGIPVMGHVGLTPQSVHQLGGFKVQGKDRTGAWKILEDALALEEAGCAAIVLEAIPARLAEAITARLQVPTIGIGAGPGCDGQVLVAHDLLGLLPGVTPRFVRRYESLYERTVEALRSYRSDVEEGSFPAAEHLYEMPEEEWLAWKARLDRESEEEQHEVWMGDAV
jgi:3-methyl-2-oxobutanoate hydroxymethyltransferase